MANPYIAAIGLAVDVGTKLANGRTEDAFSSLNPFASAGEPIEVTLNGQTTVPHKLDKVPTGYQIVCKMGEGDVWDYQAPDDRNFYLETNAGGDLAVKIVVS